MKNKGNSIVAEKAARALANGESEEFPSLWRRSMNVFFHQRGSIIAVSVVAFLVLLVLIGPLATGYGMNETEIGNRYKPPYSDHLLGTDSAGRDIFTRYLVGGRVSLFVGLTGAAVYILLGALIGGISGYFGGPADTAIMRLTDVFLCFPTYVIQLIMVAIFKPSILITIMVIGLFNWPGTSRVIRGQFLSLREQDFVLAARSVGVPGRGIITRHLLPNVINQLIVTASFGVVGAIMQEAGLSFLGLGVPFPTPSWGNMTSAGMAKENLIIRWWTWVPSSVSIVAVTLAVTFIGEGLRVALDPHRVGLK